MPALRHLLTVALVLAVGWVVAGQPLVAAAPALAPPRPEAVAEARRLVDGMKAAERGPYARIRWYCEDGAVLPPEPYACRDRGGGRQHAEFSPERERLAELGFSVGTIFAALPWERIWEPGDRHQRLRELPLERYLVGVDDGWVLRRARYYRGRVQVEDEERAGRDLLVRLLGDGAWADGHWLLAREAVRTIPHHGGSDRTGEVRRLSQEIAERDRSFERLRVKIHTAPGAQDAYAVRAWIDAARARGAAAPLVEMGGRLAEALDGLYRGGDEALAAYGRALAGHPRRAEIAALWTEGTDGSAAERLDRFADGLVRLRGIVAGSSDGAANLLLLDLGFEVERQAIRAAFERLAESGLGRGELLDLAGRLAGAAYGVGLLSAGEREALAAPIAGLLGHREAAFDDYLAAVRALRRAASWAVSTVRYTFAEPLARYTALEPEAARFVDDVVRASPLLPFAEAATRLVADADARAGIAHRMFGRAYGGMVGLNPGLAVGTLRVMPADWSGGGTARGDVVVLPETVSALEPVAGILTVAEGNLLSHVQLLARNLGIPNATVSPAVARGLVEHDGREVLLAVGTDGSIVLERLDRLPEAARGALADGGSAGPPADAKLDAPRPDLSVRRPLALDELSAALAGRVVGPKAANLGELARTFPGRVEQAIALPFGVFYDHVGGGEASPKARLDRAYAAHRAGTIDDSALAEELAEIREEISGLAIRPETRRQLEPLMARWFGPPGSYGVFVRSDTNVEDLPGFTGAGLNLTLPNVVGLTAQLAGIAKVWSSVLAERSVAWRSTILNRPEEVYASVLLMKSVPAEKSGVLVTADLATRGRGLTVATARGVGGAVDGEAAETLVLDEDGSALLVAEAKAPYRRRLAAAGGVEWVPAPAGPVLEASERQALRELAREIARRLEPARSPTGEPLPWDVEFGFVDGRLTLFQIRPLVERGQARSDRLLETLLPAASVPPTAISLIEPPAGS